MIRNITPDELRSLMRRDGTLRLSFFMPTERYGKETVQNPIRFRNLIKDAEKQIKDSGSEEPELLGVLNKARKLTEDYSFWQHQAEGLALFIGREGQTAVSLPFRPEERVIVAETFHVAPLIPGIAATEQFFLLSLSQNQVRFFRCDRTLAESVQVEGLPESMATALKYDDPERQLQLHSFAPRSAGGATAVFHGHGAGEDQNHDNSESLQRYFRMIDKALNTVLRQEHAPLVLAGVDSLFPIYRAVNSYKGLIEEGIAGNPEELSAEQLAQKARPIVAPLFNKEKNDVLDLFAQLEGTGRTSDELGRVLTASVHGGVEALLVNEAANIWGSFSAESGEISLDTSSKADNEDLLNVAALETFTNRGAVYFVPPAQMPSGSSSPIAAILRKGHEYHPATVES